MGTAAGFVVLRSLLRACRIYRVMADISRFAKLERAQA